jgi:hypothetical protein
VVGAVAKQVAETAAGRRHPARPPLPRDGRVRGGQQSPVVRRAAVLVAAGLVVVGLLGFTRASLWARKPAAASRAVHGSRASGAEPKHAEPSDVLARRVARQPSAVSTREARPVSIAGRVQTARGRAIEGAQVCAFEPNAGCCISPLCTRSDATGAFQIELEGAVTPMLLASRPGYVPSSAGPLDPRQLDATVITLGEGGATVAGSVHDAGGGPIAGAELRATDTENRVIALGVSDDSGAFELQVAPGAVRILARADGYSEERRGADAPLAGIEIRLVAASSIVGRVIAEGTADGVEGVLVSVHGDDEAFGVASSTRSESDGVFRLHGLRSGRYLLQATAPHWRSGEQRVSLAPAQASAAVDVLVRGAARLSGMVQLGGKPCTMGMISVEGPLILAAPTAPDGSVTLDGVLPGRYEVSVSCEGARLRDALDIGARDMVRAWDLDEGARVTGTVLSARGTAVAAIQVEVVPTPPSAERGGTTCITDEVGRFSCAGLAPGDYAVQILSALPQADPVTVHATLQSPPDVALRLHEQAAIRVRMVSSASVDPSTYSVLASGPRQVVLTAQPRGDALVFDAVALGDYEVFLDSDPNGSRRHVTLSRDGEVAEFTLELPQLHRLQGRVIDEEGQALPDAWVRASREQAFGFVHPTEPVLTDGDGRFALKGLVPGRYSLDVSGSEHEGHLDRVASDSTDAVVSARNVGSPSSTLTGSFQRGAPDSPSE